LEWLHASTFTVLCHLAPSPCIQVGIIPYAGAEIAFFEGMKHSWEQRRGKRLHPIGVMTTGAIAAAAAQVLTYPLALVRTRMQAQAAMIPPVTMRSCIVQVVRNDGFRGFYRVRSFPALCLKNVQLHARQWL
jgi:hypothetical protein